MTRTGIFMLILAGICAWARGEDKPPRNSPPVPPATQAQPPAPPDIPQPPPESPPQYPATDHPEAPNWPPSPPTARMNPPPAPRVRIVVPVNSVPAEQLAGTLRKLFDMERQVPSRRLSTLFVMGDSASNQLVLSGDQDEVNAAQRLVAELDRAPAMIRINVVFGELAADKTSIPTPDELRSRMEVLCQAELTTLENQPVQLQVGRREPRVQSSATTEKGRVTSAAMESVGTLLKCTSRRAADGSVTLALSVDDSRLEPIEEGAAVAEPAKGEAVRVAGTDTLQFQGTIRASDGQTVVVAAFARPPKQSKQRWILVTPHLVPIGGKSRE
jgi:type II secretory pathway component GspD/PulD (secretin)